MEKSVSIKWYGHSCFTLSADGYTVAVDPYDSGVPGYRPLSVTANEAASTHGHHDHGYVEAVSLIPSKNSSPFKIEKVASFHDNAGGSLRGKNDILVIEAHGMRFVHLGDLGHVLTPQQREKLAGADLLMIPVGGYYTIDAAEAKAVVDQVNPRVIVPMHYRFDGHGPDVIGTLDEFLKLFDAGAIVRAKSDSADITSATPRQLLVLQYAG